MLVANLDGAFDKGGIGGREMIAVKSHIVLKACACVTAFGNRPFIDQ